MAMKRFLLVGFVAFAGCTDYIRHDFTTVRRLENGFEVYIKTGHPSLDTANGREQLEWVEATNDENNFCPSGYEISERDVVRNGSSFGVKLYSINYTLTCL